MVCLTQREFSSRLSVVQIGREIALQEYKNNIVHSSRYGKKKLDKRLLDSFAQNLALNKVARCGALRREAKKLCVVCIARPNCVNDKLACDGVVGERIRLSVNIVQRDDDEIE